MNELEKPTKLDEILMWLPIPFFGDEGAEKYYLYSAYENLRQDSGERDIKLIFDKAMLKARGLRSLVYFGYAALAINLYFVYEIIDRTF